MKLYQGCQACFRSAFLNTKQEVGGRRVRPTHQQSKTNPTTNQTRQSTLGSPRQVYSKQLQCVYCFLVLPQDLGGSFKNSIAWQNTVYNKPAAFRKVGPPVTVPLHCIVMLNFLRGGNRDLQSVTFFPLHRAPFYPKLSQPKGGLSYF